MLQQPAHANCQVLYFEPPCTSNSSAWCKSVHPEETPLLPDSARPIYFAPPASQHTSRPVKRDTTTHETRRS